MSYVVNNFQRVLGFELSMRMPTVWKGKLCTGIDSTEDDQSVEEQNTCKERKRKWKRSIEMTRAVN